MVKCIFDGGRGFSVDRLAVQSEVDFFAQRLLRDKTLNQLRLIEAIPSLTVTPELLLACGFLSRQARDEVSVIYIKMVVGNKNTLDQMCAQGHDGSQRYARKLKAVVTDDTRPPHVSELPAKHEVRNLARPTCYYISRYINGVERQRGGEYVSRLDTTLGNRPWTSAVYNSHGDHSLIEYWPLVDHSDLLGTKWFRRMVGDLTADKLG